MSYRKAKRSFITTGIVLLLLVIFPSLVRLFTDWSWFSEIGFAEIFKTTVGAKFITGAVAGLVVFALIYLNIRIASRLTRNQQTPNILGEFGDNLEKYISKLFLPISLVIGLFSGLAASSYWATLLKFLNSTPFNIADPIFNKDISYYIFTLPFIRVLIGFGFWVVVISLLGAGFLYIAAGLFSLPQRFTKFGINPSLVQEAPVVTDKEKHPARIHLLTLTALFFLLLALNAFFVRIPELLYSTTGTFLGASYADVHAALPLLKVLTFIALAGVILILVDIYRQKNRLVIFAVGLYIITSVVLGIYPALVQKLIVVPNELAKEEPYIKHNIAATQVAWGLDDVEKRDLTADTELTMDDINDNQLTIKNVRLWDREPLLDTFSQIQEIRTYYEFNSVDNDRYNIDGEYRQIMSSPRELNTQNLPNKTFINERFTFTHGYGMTMGPVNQVTDEGLPLLFTKDIPPTSSKDSLQIKRPEIYYGELASDYVFVKTNANEFDYPEGEDNVFAKYQGDGGVAIDSLLDKALYAMRFGSLKILLSNDITNDSRVMFYRDITERVSKVMPFLELDKDPYLIVTKEGEQKWIYDAYTSSNLYPYSQVVANGDNYMCNSVKVVIDAYDGQMQFYISDPDDPIIQTYSKIFPNTFQAFTDMPADIKPHVRYPETIFTYQTQLYKTYHMEQPQVFYNKEDQWEIPTRNNAAHDPIMRHLIMKLPGEQQEEFILMLPYTPRNKDNMASWLAARSDGDNYGKLVVYKFGKQKLVFGPTQINNRINQDAEISQQISLWDQRGSEVIQGNLLVIPIRESLIYVRPLYIRAEGGKIPELKRVIVAYENKIAMEETLDQSLQKIFGGQVKDSSVTNQKDSAKSTDNSTKLETSAELAAQAQKIFQEAQAAQRSGDWALYGEKMKELGEILQKMSTKTQ